MAASGSEIPPSFQHVCGKQMYCHICELQNIFMHLASWDRMSFQEKKDEEAKKWSAAATHILQMGEVVERYGWVLRATHLAAVAHTLVIAQYSWSRRPRRAAADDNVPAMPVFPPLHPGSMASSLFPHLLCATMPKGFATIVCPTPLQDKLKCYVLGLELNGSDGPTITEMRYLLCQQQQPQQPLTLNQATSFFRRQLRLLITKSDDKHTLLRQHVLTAYPKLSKDIRDGIPDNRLPQLVWTDLSFAVDAAAKPGALTYLFMGWVGPAPVLAATCDAEPIVVFSHAIQTQTGSHNFSKPTSPLVLHMRQQHKPGQSALLPLPVELMQALGPRLAPHSTLLLPQFVSALSRNASGGLFEHGFFPLLMGHDTDRDFFSQVGRILADDSREFMKKQPQLESLALQRAVWARDGCCLPLEDKAFVARGFQPAAPGTAPKPSHLRELQERGLFCKIVARHLSLQLAYEAVVQWAHVRATLALGLTEVEVGRTSALALSRHVPSIDWVRTLQQATIRNHAEDFSATLTFQRPSSTPTDRIAVTDTLAAVQAYQACPSLNERLVFTSYALYQQLRPGLKDEFLTVYRTAAAAAKTTPWIVFRQPMTFRVQLNM